MALDDELVRNAQRAAARLIDCERDLDRARGDYHHAVRKLHLAGASMREIATALDLSHQRVHQIIESVGGSARRWKRSRSDAQPGKLSCSFCGLEQSKVRKIVAGPGVYICNECVPRAARALSDEAGVDAEPSSLETVNRDRGRHCSFCGRAGVQVGRRAAAPGGAVNICGDCVHLCQDIVAERL